MKLSVKVQDQPQQDDSNSNNPYPLLLRAKLPITVLGLPFLSAVSTSDPSDLSFSLRTNFTSGPSLRLSYSPTTTKSTSSPLSLTLKSGVSLFGSPTNSPLVISAHFTIHPQNPNPNPTFSLQFKPQFGDFSLRKTIHSSPPPNPNPSSKPDADATSMGFVPLERPPSAWKELSLDNDLSSSSGKASSSILSGIAVVARTRLPVTGRVAVSCRWGVNFPADVTKRMPFLTVSKIGIERVDEVVKEVKEAGVRDGNGNNGNVGDLEALKGLCLSVGRELEVLQRENREMRQGLEEMRLGKLRGWSYEGYGDGGLAKKAPPVGSGDSGGGFEQRKNKKGGGAEERRQRELKKNGNRASDVESELQRALKAAASS